MVEKSDQEEDDQSFHSLWIRVAAMFASISLVAIVFTLVALLTNTEAPKPHLPHIIFILADDLGWNDVSFHGSPQILTPNIDALAASGVVLNNYYTHPQCTPSRGALLSGKYANRLGLQHGNLKPAEASGLPLNIAILPEYMTKRGYKAHMIGKWHLGYYKKSYLPTRRGFDTFFGFLNDHIDYFDYTCYYKDDDIKENESVIAYEEANSTANASATEILTEVFGIDLWENEEIVRGFRGDYITNVFTDRAVDLIAEHNLSKPLFLFVSHAATRAGNSFFPFQSTPESFEKNNHINDFDRRIYAGMVQSLDDSVGRIFEALNQRSMLSNSVIVVSSDNGGAADTGPGSNWPLRGTKFTLWEGGVRSIGVVWSSLLNLEQPVVDSNLMHITDWLPTFYSLTGGDVNDLGDIDGVNMWPVWTNMANSSPRNEVLLNVDSLLGTASLRKGDMKLLVSPTAIEGSDWYGPSGLEDNNATDLMDTLVWSNRSLVKNILVESKMWLLPENNTWRNEATIFCGENFLPVSGKCDFTDGPCLYNVTDDPCEYKNIASLNPEIVQSLLDRLRDLNATSLPVQSKVMDPLGDPLCHNFAHVPWMDEDEVTKCS